jgi:hypothetical protein
MKNEKITRSWGVATAIIAAVVCIAAAALWLATAAKAQKGQECFPAVSIQWQSQSILETKFSARIIEDNRAIKAALQALAKNTGMTVDEMTTRLGKTYLRSPRLWIDGAWKEGWEGVLPYLKKIVAGSTSISIDSISALVEYQTYAGAKSVEEDVDARATVRMTFSASPGGNFIEGTLKHMRVCEIQP